MCVRQTVPGGYQVGNAKCRHTVTYNYALCQVLLPGTRSDCYNSDSQDAPIEHLVCNTSLRKTWKEMYNLTMGDTCFSTFFDAMAINGE